MKYAFLTYVSAALFGLGVGAGCAVESTVTEARGPTRTSDRPSGRSTERDQEDDLEQLLDASAPSDSDDEGDASAAADSGAVAQLDAGAAGRDGPKLEPVTSVEVAGPYEVTIEQAAGPNRGWIARPKNLGEGGFKHPVFSWGCGGGSQPSQYRDHLTRWASHGFVVEAHVSTGNAKDHTVVFDWVTSENERQGSAYYQKLDPTKIAAGGHSMGSVATFAAASDPRLSTTVHVAGGSFDGNGYRTLKKPVAYLAGANDALGATQNAERDYKNTNDVPVFFTVMTGVDHIMAAREALAPITAWLRWHIAGETERKAQFIGPSCDFCKGKFKSQSKGWD
ncbi:MAG: hypothetical protein ABW252_22115 [Polyangiales bacterium]